MPERLLPRDVAVAMITTPTHALISQRRSSDSFPLLWEFPGGARERGETLEQCVVRERQEELAQYTVPPASGPLIEAVRRRLGGSINGRGGRGG